jgi:hypothetical protein
MFKKLLLMIALILPITVFGQEIKPASESEHTLLNKSETIALIKQVAPMPVAKQKEKVAQLWAADADSKTPRSDFLYCTAFAYLNYPQAQACLARAFENGHGIVSNLTDAYVWYTVALENPAISSDLKDKVEAEQTRIKMTLFSVYPTPTDFELEEAVKKQQELIKEYK